jgi:predicted thioesterase
MSDFNLQPGLKAEKKESVTTDNTALRYGSGDIEVYATPAMIGLMEGASLAAVASSLPTGFSTVGTHLSVAHMAATPVGMEVRAEAELVEIHGKRLVFQVRAFDAQGLIGDGTHERFIVETAKFMAKAQVKADNQ